MRYYENNYRAFTLVGTWPQIQLAGWELLERGYRPGYRHLGGPKATMNVGFKTKSPQEFNRLVFWARQLGVEFSKRDLSTSAPPFTLSCVATIPGPDGEAVQLVPCDVALPTNLRTLLRLPKRQQVRWTVLVDTQQHDLERICTSEGIVHHAFDVAQARVLYLRLNENRNRALRRLGVFLRIASGLPIGPTLPDSSPERLANQMPDQLVRIQSLLDALRMTSYEIGLGC
jgi:hypothetical protein